MLVSNDFLLHVYCFGNSRRVAMWLVASMSKTYPFTLETFLKGELLTRKTFSDVYTKLVEMDLFEAGFDTEWETVEVPRLHDNTWRDTKRRYWVPKEYKLPICTFTS